MADDRSDHRFVALNPTLARTTHQPSRCRAGASRITDLAESR